MTKRVLAFIALVLCFAIGETHAQSLENLKVRVKLLKLPLPIELHGDGISIERRSLEKFKRAAIQPFSQNKVTIDAQKTGQEKIWVVKAQRETMTASGSLIEVNSRFGSVMILGHRVPTPFYLSSKNIGADLIVSLPLENYIAGVLHGEMPGSWPIEALKAQAIAARSYTLSKVLSHSDEIYHLESSIADQVYLAPKKSAPMDRFMKAVTETRGLVLNQNSKVIRAFYHSSCGGQTESPENNWKGEVTRIGSVKDQYCPYSPHQSWAYKTSKRDLLKAIQKKGHNLSRFDEIEVLARTPSQRVTLLAFNDTHKNVLISGQDLRQILGYSNIRSTLFWVTSEGESVVFKGRGFGHGSGLCQWGARRMAESGRNFKDILKYYYPGASVFRANVIHL